MIFPIIEDECDVVIGSSFLDDASKMKRYRNFGIQWFTNIIRLITGFKITDSTSGFRAVRSDFVRRVLFDLRENVNEYDFSEQNMIHNLSTFNQGLDIINKVSHFLDS